MNALEIRDTKYKNSFKKSITYRYNVLQVIGRIFGRLLDKNIWFHKACAVVIIISAGRSHGL